MNVSRIVSVAERETEKQEEAERLDGSAMKLLVLACALFAVASAGPATEEATSCIKGACFPIKEYRYEQRVLAA